MKIPTPTQTQHAATARTTVTRRRTPLLIHPAVSLSECAVILKALRRAISTPILRPATVEEQNEFWLTMRMLEISLEQELRTDRAGVAAKLGLALDPAGSMFPKAAKGVAA